MTLIAVCPSCGKSLMVPGAAAGKRTKCPDCASIVPIPTPEEAQASLGSSYRLGAIENRRRRLQKRPPLEEAPHSSAALPQHQAAARDDFYENDAPQGWRGWLGRLFGSRTDE